MSDAAFLSAFLDAAASEVFHSIEHRHEIWRQDPFDVESLHQEARERFARLLNRATTPPGLESGRILLLLGESGCGKTHLVRAFRNFAHAQRRGYVGYMQMTTQTDRYPHYVLSNLIDSLDQSYYETTGPGVTSLMRISRALAGKVLSRADLARLHDRDELAQEEADALVFAAADRLMSRPEYAEVDLDLVRALLYLQRDDPRVKHRVLKLIRCEHLVDSDRHWIGGLAPRTADDAPARMVEAFGRLFWAVDNSALVLCLDQLEEMFSFDDKDVRFRRAIAAVCDLADRVPSCLVVISCLSDFYTALRPMLSRPHVDRLEQDPEPIRLSSTLTEEQVRELIERRLAVLHEQAQLTGQPSSPIFPFDDAFIRGVVDQRTRDILDVCRLTRQRSIREGHYVSSMGAAAAPPNPAPFTSLEQAWNDFRTAFAEPRPSEDEQVVELLGWAVEHAGDELETGHSFRVQRSGGRLQVEVERDGRREGRLHAHLCNRGARGGGLRKQLDELRKAAGSEPFVMLRSTDFPDGAGTDIVRCMAELIAGGARRTVVEDSELLTMLALRRFRERERAHPQLAEWLHAANPLTQLRSMRIALDLDRIEPTRGQTPPLPVYGKTPTPAPVTVTPSATSSPVKPLDPDALTLGETDGLFKQPVLLPLDELKVHAAFLGGTGSGKTTLALGIIEQLLERGVPAVLIDRKGDLCDVVRLLSAPTSIDTPPALRALQPKVSPALFTPGHPEGRPLTISLLPDGIAELSDDERDGEAQFAAQALAGMLGYAERGGGNQQRAVLIQALQVLARAGRSFNLAELVAFVDAPDPALVAAAGRLDPKLFAKVTQDLETLRLTTSRLFDGGGEKLEVDRLFRPHHGRVPLTVISTKFLGDNAKVLFWVAQFLLQVARWAGRHPSPRLQGVLLFDEADLYLPATRQPATKGPLENLLRRARSSGLGVMLASQSPGDFDYRSRDNIMSWLVGCISQPVSIRKMQPLLADARADISGKLASRKTGEFFLLRKGEVSGFRAARPALMPAGQVADTEILSLAKALAIPAGRSAPLGVTPAARSAVE